MRDFFKWLFGITLTILVVLVSLSISSWFDRYKKFENFRLYGQEMSNWCWAASSQMAYNYVMGYEDSLSQKDIVKFVINKDTPDSLLCCTRVSYENSIIYNQKIEYDSLRKRNTLLNAVFTSKGIVYEQLKMSEVNKDTIWVLLKESLTNLEPAILFDLNYQKYGSNYDITSWWSSHVVLVTGVVELTDKERWLVVGDPWSNSRCSGCSYYLNFDSIFRTNTNNGQINVKNTSLIYGIKKKKNTLLDAISLQVVRFIDTGLQDAQTEIERKIIEIKKGVSRSEREMRCTVKNNFIGAYAIQLIGQDGKTQTVFFWRDTKREDIFFDTIQGLCFFETYIPQEVQVYNINFSDNQTEILFLYNLGNYLLPLNDFNQFLLSKDKKEFLEKNSLKPIIL